MGVINSYLQPHYLVTGVMRSGTSMMTEALGQCIPVYWRPRSNEHKWQGIGHHCYEPPVEDQKAEAFPWHPLYAGLLMKCFYDRIMNLNNTGTFYIVYMLRKYPEIRESMRKVFEMDNPIREQEIYEETTQGQIRELEGMDNVTLNVFYYHEVLEAPLKCFEVLKLNGWPIEPKKCSAIVQPSKQTVRLSE